MDDAVRRILRVFDTLSTEQKRELLRSLQGYEVRGVLEESVRKDMQVSLGPLGGRCPYCGK